MGANGELDIITVLRKILKAFGDRGSDCVGTPSGWIATNALMAAGDPRFADEFWAAIDERGGLSR